MPGCHLGVICKGCVNVLCRTSRIRAHPVAHKRHSTIPVHSTIIFAHCPGAVRPQAIILKKVRVPGAINHIFAVIKTPTPIVIYQGEKSWTEGGLRVGV